jgi:hypothetical protein
LLLLDEGQVENVAYGLGFDVVVPLNCPCLRKGEVGIIESDILYPEIDVIDKFPYISDMFVHVTQRFEFGNDFIVFGNLFLKIAVDRFEGSIEELKFLVA